MAQGKFGDGLSILCLSSLPLFIAWKFSSIGISAFKGALKTEKTARLLSERLSKEFSRQPKN